MSEVAVGSRVRCDVCGSEAIVTKGGEAEIKCCDRPVSQG